MKYYLAVTIKEVWLHVTGCMDLELKIQQKAVSEKHTEGDSIYKALCYARLKNKAREQ